MPKNNGHGQAAILSDSEYAKIRKQLQSNSHRLFFDIARWTGERWGAIAQLQVRDVYRYGSTPHDYITFRASTRKADPDGSRHTRQVPVHPTLRELLLAYTPAAESVWLFPGSAKGAELDRPIIFSTADKWLRAAVAKAGLEGRGISTHSTRRTLITRLNNAGVDIRTIQAVTGHRDLKALTRYIEVSPERVKMAIANL